MKTVRALSVLTILLVMQSLSMATSIDGPYTTSTPIPSTLTDWNGTLAFQKFNPALGTLVSMDLALTGNISTVLTIKNTSPTGSTGNAHTQVTFTVQDPGSNLVSEVPDISTSNFPFALEAGETITTGTLSKLKSDTQSYTDPTILSEFTGLGNMVLNAGTKTTAWIGYTGGNTDASQVTQGSLTGQVTYYFIPVPEPATLTLLGLGLVGLLRRRFK